MRPMELERNDGDEFYPNGIFEFHITRMNEYINQHQGEFEKVEIDVEFYYRYFKNHDINQMYVEQANLERPVIFAEITPDRLYNGYLGIREDYY